MLLRAQYQDPESWAANKVVLTAFATFAAAVVGISQLGDLLVPVSPTLASHATHPALTPRASRRPSERRDSSLSLSPLPL